MDQFWGCEFVYVKASEQRESEEFSLCMVWIITDQ